MSTIIPLTQGLSTIVDDDCADLLKFKWHAHRKARSYFYASRQEGGKTISMHREITGAAKGQVVDHINGDTLDNRRANLRLCTQASNCINRKINKNSKSGIKGVTREGPSWRARIKCGGKTYLLGFFATPEEAQSAYEAKARELHGAFRRKH